MLQSLFRSLWANITLFLFWLFGNVNVKINVRSKHKFTNSRPNNRIVLTSLPNELLFSIIERIPVNDLICKLPRICSKFEKITKFTCNRRRSLNVICGDSKCLIPPRLNSPSCTLKLGTISQLNVQNCKKIISTFPSVRSLQLNASASHRSYQQLYLESIFPNLRAIHYENIVSNCTICGFDHFNYMYENWWFRMKRTKCINLMIQGVVQT